MSDLPTPASSGPADLYPARRPGGLALTPDQLVARKRNRRWMLMIAVPSVIVLVLALVASAIAESNSPSGPKVVAPRGYQAVNDGYFSYVVPSSWPTNPSYTDSAGDVEHSGPTGWAAEHIGFRTTAPVLGEARPSSLAAFGMPRPEPYALTAGHPIQVAGAAGGFSYDMTRPGGFHATVVDAWDSHHGVELWLVVNAPAAITAQILSHLKT